MAKTSPSAIQLEKGVAEYHQKQSNLKQLDGVLPMRAIVSGPSGSGKGRTMSSMILHQFRGCFARCYIISPTAGEPPLDETWQPCLDYIRTFTPEDEDISWNTWSEEKLEKVLQAQEERVRSAKAEGKEIPGILIIIDDYADRADIVKRPDNVVTRLFFSGRHIFCSTWLSVQRVRSLSMPIRLNATALLIFKCRNHKEYLIFEEELSALVDKKTFRSLYDAATEEAHSFLLVLPNRPLARTFYIRFEHGISFSRDSSSIISSKSDI
jgi:hypothetical protein